MPRSLDDFPIEPGEELDLRIHVRNCMNRHIALVRFIQRDMMASWLYRAVTVPLLMSIVWKMYFGDSPFFGKMFAVLSVILEGPGGS